ncbi:MAG: carbohydrate-binding family 9-like protein [Acidobacteria bacterium]|nr:carbohydrate-binding family 9-like protein [Acidobacteriota bacterium]
MNGFVKTLLMLLLFSSMAAAADQAVIESIRAAQDIALDLDPTSPFWHASSQTFVEKDTQGNVLPRYRTEVRTRWTKDNIYFLFICPYQQLYLKPSPATDRETNQLWNWNVAEVFIGSDFKDIQRYKEFEVSPQAEWIDLDIDLHKPHHEDGWTWNSGFEVKARIDAASHTWYAAMRIPIASIDTRPAVPGNVLRINLFRSEGPPSDQHEVTWQAPMKNTFHVPERFGLIRLVDKRK